MSSDKNIQTLQDYFLYLRNILNNKSNEHTLRTPFENLLNAIKQDKQIKIIHEPKSEQGQGDIRPDFKVYKEILSQKSLNYSSLVGFIECKAFGENLDKHIKGKQIDKYLSISPNIMLTNYNRFIVLNYDNILHDFTLFPHNTKDIQANLFAKDFESAIAKDLNPFYNLLQDFFGTQFSTIKSKAELVKVLSMQSFYLGVKAREFYHLEPRTTFHKFFEKTYATFREIISYEFSQEEFCDILGQSVVYGLLVAHLETKNNDLELTQIQDIVKFLPEDFALLQEFIYFTIPSFHIPESISYAIENIKKTIILIDKSALATIMQTNIESISLYLYEDFLKAYDELRATQKRKEGGVFYTPEPVVNAIVSNLDFILKHKLDKAKGFANEDVKVLDFATGTGSFLAKVFEKILESESSEVWKNEAIRNKFLKDIYGFELSFVPYIVAHIKLGQILKSAGFKNLSHENKLQIFLTNTLNITREQDITMQMPLLLLEEENKKAQTIKFKEELLVILGNPPYNQNSKNNQKEILNKLETYKNGLNETNIQPLNNDYIKFLRFAQWKLLENAQNSLFSHKHGTMGFITANSFIWGRTHRKMRESLYKAFDEIYILNLHGDSEKDSKDDENVFDIRVGVCISFFIKYENSTNENHKVFYYSTSENQIYKRKDKFALLNEFATKGLNSLKWQELEMNEPFFWFIKKDFSNAEYENFWSLANDEAMKNWGGGGRMEFLKLQVVE